MGHYNPPRIYMSQHTPNVICILLGKLLWSSLPSLLLFRVLCYATLDVMLPVHTVILSFCSHPIILAHILLNPFPCSGLVK